MSINGSGKPVLVSLNGSDGSAKTAWWAANYAAHSGLSLHILSIPSQDGNLPEVKQVLSVAKGIALAQGVAENMITTLSARGEVSTVLTEISANYDLIVIGSRGQGGLAERVWHAASSTVPAAAYCPVVVVPCRDNQGKVIHLNSSIKRVLVGSDESRWGVRALDLAADLAAGWSAELEVVSAAPSPSMTAGVFSAKPSQEDLEAILFDMEAEQQGRIARIKQRHPHLEVLSRSVAGSAVQSLIHESDQADIIVVGSRGRGGLTGLILGSVSQDLIEQNPHPTHVITHHKPPAFKLPNDVYSGFWTIGLEKNWLCLGVR